MKKQVGSLLIVIALCSCGNSSSHSNYSFEGSDAQNESEYVDEYEFDDEGYSEESSQMVACPMCGGSGVFEFMPGDIMAPKQTCQGCGGNGQVTIAQAQQIEAAINQMNGIMNGNADYGSGGNSGRSSYQIEMELRKAYELLQSMEYDYENCTSGVLRAQYSNMIAEQKQRIAQLEQELRYAQ